MPVDSTGKVGIKYATPSASGYIPAPWRVSGKVARLESGAVKFDLLLTVPAGGAGPTKTNAFKMKMSGQMAMLGHPVFSDATSLDGWKTYGVGPHEEKQGSSTILDYGAKPDTGGRFKTIRDIRAYIAKEDDPGVADPTKDFTGFWKEKCEQSFGLQVTRAAPDGKYSIVFCGPGGCGDLTQSRKTFITGDKRFEVISEDELIEIRRSGEKQRHIRCSRDPRPVLR